MKDKKRAVRLYEHEWEAVALSVEKHALAQQLQDTVAVAVGRSELLRIAAIIRRVPDRGPAP